MAGGHQDAAGGPPLAGYGLSAGIRASRQPAATPSRAGARGSSFRMPPGLGHQ